MSGKITQQKEPLTRSRFEGLVREVTQAINYFDKQIEEATRHEKGAQERIEKLDAEIANLTKAGENYRLLKDDQTQSPRERNDAEHRIAKCNNAIKERQQKKNERDQDRIKLQKRIAALNGDKAFVEKNMAWCDRVRKAWDQMEKAGTVSFVLYVEVEGEKVEIVRTRSDAP